MGVTLLFLGLVVLLLLGLGRDQHSLQRILQLTRELLIRGLELRPQPALVGHQLVGLLKELLGQILELKFEVLRW